MDVGFIGLGLMGRPMAANLLKAGHKLRIWNRSPGAGDELVKLGATRVATAAEAFCGDAIISILANDGALRETLTDEVMAAGRGSVHVNAATISVTLAKELGERHAKAGVAYVSAPVFGRPEVATAGLLNIVAGGAPEAIARAQPLLDVMGGKTWPAGDDPVQANIIKIAGNFMIASALETMGEATALARSYGVDKGVFLDILNNTLFASPVYKGYGAIIAEQKYEPAGFTLPLGLKDVGLALSASHDKNVAMPFASVLRDNFLDALAHGNPKMDWASIAEVSHRRAKLGD